MAFFHFFTTFWSISGDFLHVVANFGRSEKLTCAKLKGGILAPNVLFQGNDIGKSEELTQCDWPK